MNDLGIIKLQVDYFKDQDGTVRCASLETGKSMVIFMRNKEGKIVTATLGMPVIPVETLLEIAKAFDAPSNGLHTYKCSRCGYAYTGDKQLDCSCGCYTEKI